MVCCLHGDTAYGSARAVIKPSGLSARRTIEHLQAVWPPAPGSGFNVLTVLGLRLTLSASMTMYSA